jgi:hypothetical protein
MNAISSTTLVPFIHLYGVNQESGNLQKHTSHNKLTTVNSSSWSPATPYFRHLHRSYVICMYVKTHSSKCDKLNHSGNLICGSTILRASTRRHVVILSTDYGMFYL